MPASTAASPRTEQLAQALLKEMNQNGEYEIETLNLEDEDLKLFTVGERTPGIAYKSRKF